MIRATRSVLAAAVAAAALAAAPARADHDCDRPAPPAAHPVYAPLPAPPAYAPAPPAYAPAPTPAHFRAGSRFRELREEYSRLEQARRHFYATWHGNPWRRDRFESWYAARHAELDRRWAELASWRGRERWNG